MTSEWLREWLLDVGPNVSTPALERLIEMMKENSSLLLRGRFSNAQGGGCLVEHAGRSVFPDSDTPGVDFLNWVGLANWSHLIVAWDSSKPGSNFEKKLLRVLETELWLRNGDHHEAEGESGCRGALDRDVFRHHPYRSCGHHGLLPKGVVGAMGRHSSDERDDGYVGRLDNCVCCAGHGGSLY